ncbi:MAG: hypothetical protein KatS3mg087_1162 [Patescibacteria group bacterium]|nr:MAG: hypothetical protein KatS3mg087_1162 [Patescibacteria group bacterium]
MSSYQLTDSVIEACKIAKQEIEGDNSSFNVIAAKKNVSSKGRINEWWYRMRWDNASKKWTYISNERLPIGSFRARERYADVWGEVFNGEIIAQHDYKGPLTKVYLAVNEQDGRLVELAWQMDRSRQNIIIKLPDGSELTLPNPRPLG